MHIAKAKKLFLRSFRAQNKDMSRYSVEDIYCYPGSSVLRNKLGLKDQDQLDQYEAEITVLRLVAHSFQKIIN